MLVGVEGTGAYEAGLAGHLREQYVAVVEIDHPDRNARRRQGKSDPVDAEGRLAPPSPSAAPAYSSSATAG